MSGHSKWKTIAHKKEKTDAGRAKIFTKLSREIIVAVRAGGGDPNNNARLKDCIAKARANNVPADNIKRVIDRTVGSSDSANYESVVYEGYGPSSVAVIVEALTDNRNRTAADVRHLFDKHGAGMGTTGCVSWAFDEKGVIIIERGTLDEDEVMLAALDAGATDFEPDDDVFEVFTNPSDFSAVREALEQHTILEAGVQKIPQNWVTLTDEEDIKKMQRLLDALEDNDDVQNVYHNWEMDD